MEGHHEKLLRMLKAQAKVHEINEHHETVEEISSKDKNVDEPEGIEIAGEAAATMNDVNEMDVCDTNDINLKNALKC